MKRIEVLENLEFLITRFSDFRAKDVSDYAFAFGYLFANIEEIYERMGRDFNE